MPETWSFKDRSTDIAKTENSHYDLIIIGGGITGAGIARECALRNISFCLLDKQDFAFGTSSRSSKLFHGGMRYLASGEFALVRESTGERNWLRCHLPNLVRPLGFIYPSYERGKARPYMIRLGIFLYDILSDWFSHFKNYRKSRIFKPSFVEEFEPALATEDPDLGKLTTAGFYYDTNCDDARVTLEIIKESLDYANGRSSALNYARVDGLVKNDNSIARGVRVTDIFDNRSFTITGQCVVSAAGIWTDQVLALSDYDQARIYPTKGVHIVVPNERLGNRNAISLASLDDGRFFFVLRRERVSLIGTTDTAYSTESQDLDEPWCNKEDCDYLLRTVNRMFPQARLNYNDIISAYAGIRPLIRQEGAKHESDVSRKHEIFKTADGVIAIAGGKSTTHRRMAEDLLFYLIEHKHLKCVLAREQARKGFSKKPFKIGLSRKDFYRITAEQRLQHYVHPDQLEHLYTQFGYGGITILETIKNKPEIGQPLLKDYPHSQAEIEYILEHEYAPKLIDILCRRTEAQWTIWHYRQPELAEASVKIMADYYGWNEQRITAEVTEYLDYVNKNVQFIKDQS